MWNWLVLRLSSLRFFMLLSVFLDLRELIFVVVLHLDNNIWLIVAFRRHCLVALELALGR